MKNNNTLFLNQKLIVFFTQFTALMFVLITFGCGGGGSSEKSNSNETDNNNEQQTSQKRTGALIDSRVGGIGYQTESFSGTTNAHGEFSYLEGEIVSFFIGDLLFPQVQAQGIITPMILAGANSDMNQQAINIARLLQSLDEDADLSNGISIPAGAAAIAQAIDFDVDSSSFENDPGVINLISNSGSVNQSLLSEMDVIEHLQSQLNIVGTWVANSSSNAALILSVDGSFIYLENDESPSGIETGSYVYESDSSTITFSVDLDENGGGGIAPDLDNVAVPVALSINAITLTVVENEQSQDYVFNKQLSGGTAITGTWIQTLPDNSVMALVLLDDGTFFYTENRIDGTSGMEAGSYQHNESENTIRLTVSTDNNSSEGIAPYFENLDISLDEALYFIANKQPSDGIFFGGTISGMSYRSSSATGTIDGDGGFRFLTGDSIEFFIGEVSFAQIPAQAAIDLMDFSSDEAPGRITFEIVNMARFLLSIGTGAETSIARVVILPEYSDLFISPIDFDVDKGSFENNATVKQYLSQTSGRTELIDFEQAVYFVEQARSKFEFEYTTDCDIFDILEQRQPAYCGSGISQLTTEIAFSGDISTEKWGDTPTIINDQFEYSKVYIKHSNSNMLTFIDMVQDETDYTPDCVWIAGSLECNPLDTFNIYFDDNYDGSSFSAVDHFYTQCQTLDKPPGYDGPWSKGEAVEFYDTTFSLSPTHAAVSQGTCDSSGPTEAQVYEGFGPTFNNDQNHRYYVVSIPANEFCVDEGLASVFIGRTPWTPKLVSMEGFGAGSGCSNKPADGHLSMYFGEFCNVPPFEGVNVYLKNTHETWSIDASVSWRAEVPDAFDGHFGSGTFNYTNIPPAGVRKVGCTRSGWSPFTSQTWTYELQSATWSAR